MSENREISMFVAKKSSKTSTLVLLALTIYSLGFLTYNAIDYSGFIEETRLAVIDRLMTAAEKQNIIDTQKLVVKLTTENLQLNQQNYILTNKLENALVPESSVKEAAEVHVVTPVKNYIRGVNNSAIDVRDAALEKTKKLYHELF